MLKEKNERTRISRWIEQCAMEEVRKGIFEKQVGGAS